MSFWAELRWYTATESLELHWDIARYRGLEASLESLEVNHGIIYTR